MIDRRAPHQVGKNIAKGINEGMLHLPVGVLMPERWQAASDSWTSTSACFRRICSTGTMHLALPYCDLNHTCRSYYTRPRPRNPRGKLDWAIVEATAITEDGGIIPGASVGATPEILHNAERIIIEVNTRIPNFEGLHDIVESRNPPYRQPYLVQHTSDRIGVPYISVDPERVFAIVESDKPDNTKDNDPESEASKAIAGHLIHFFEDEVASGRLPKSLLPLQSGIGNVR